MNSSRNGAYQPKVFDRLGNPSPGKRRKLDSSTAAGVDSDSHPESGFDEDDSSQAQALGRDEPIPTPAADLGKRPNKAAKVTAGTQFAARVRLKAGASSPLDARLSLTELEATGPVSVLENVLPSALASTLLQDLSHAGPDWVRGSWWMFGKQHAAPRTSAFFTLPRGEVRLLFTTSASTP